MNEIQAIKQNDNRRIISELRKLSKGINQFYRNYPFCDECGCRAPRGHTEHIYSPMLKSED